MVGSTLTVPGADTSKLPPGATGPNVAGADSNAGTSGRYINNPENPTNPLLTFQPGSWTPDPNGINQFTPTPKPVSVISTQQGATVVQQKQDQAARLAAPPPATSTTDTVDTTKNTDTSKTDTSTGTPTKISLINPDTQQTISFSGDSIDQATVQKYLDAGFSLSDAEGSLPSWLGPTGTTSNPALDTANTALTSAKTTLDSAVSKLTSFDVSNDPQLKSMLSDITAQWDQRIKDMQNAEDSRIAALKTTGYRTGMQWTGGDGGVTGSIISGEERAAVDKISSLQQQKSSALVAAQQAFQSGKWTQYSKLVDVAQTAYNQQLTQVQALQKAQVTQDTKLQTATKAGLVSSSIANLYSKGITDPSAILDNLRNNGDTTTTLKDVAAGIKAISPTSAAGDTFKFSQGQQSQLIAAGLSKDEMQALHDYYNGNGHSDAITSLTPEQQTAVHDALNGTAAKKAASAVPTYAQLHPKAGTGTAKSYVSGGLTYSADTLGKLQSKLVRGSDGYTDPYIYKAAFDAWTADGGLAKDFTKNFPPKSYVNPAADWLPKYLDSKTSAASTVVNPFATPTK